MTLSLHLPLVGFRFGLARDVPAVPDQVRGPMVVTEGTVLHDVDGCDHGDRWPADTAEVLARGVVWCRTCWPGHRCQTCRFPSGPDDLCRRCGTAKSNLERRIDNAA